MYEDDDDDELDLIPCPNCNEDVYEDAERCPSCGFYVVRDRTLMAWQGKPWLWIVLALLGIGAVIYTTMGWAF